MKDFIPKGTGNSRWMKSSIPTGTTWEEALAMLRAGTFPFDLNGINAVGVAQMGDALNKANLLPDAVAALFGLGSDAVPSDVFQILSQAALYKTVTQTAQLGTLPEGSIIYLNENGTPVPFYVAKQDYEPNYNTNRVLIVRKENYANGAWNDSGSTTYNNSTIDNWMNQVYLQILDENVQTSINTTNIPATSPSSSNVIRLEKSIFPLSLTEYGLSSGSANIEGTPLAIANELLKTSNNHWTRSPVKNSSRAVFSVTADSVSDMTTANNSTVTYRPAFTLPSNFTAATIPPTTGLYDVFDNLLLKLPNVQIATGSYTGTGTYGQSNPNSLTFEFDPKFVVIYSQINGANDYSVGSPAFMINSANGLTQNTQSNSYAWWGYLSVTWNGNTVSYYSNNNLDQKNISGNTYFYIAIG